MAGLTPIKEPDNLTTNYHPRPTNEKTPQADRDAPSPPATFVGTEKMNDHDKSILQSGDNELIKFMGFNGPALTWAVTIFATGKQLLQARVSFEIAPNMICLPFSWFLSFRLRSGFDVWYHCQ